MHFSWNRSLEPPWLFPMALSAWLFGNFCGATTRDVMCSRRRTDRNNLDGVPRCFDDNRWLKLFVHVLRSLVMKNEDMFFGV